MKVVYEKCISEKIIDAVCKADIAGKKIKYIELSGDEWESLSGEFGGFCRHVNLDNKIPADFAGYFAGVLISVREEEDK